MVSRMNDMCTPHIIDQFSSPPRDAKPLEAPAISARDIEGKRLREDALRLQEEREEQELRARKKVIMSYQ